MQSATPAESPATLQAQAAGRWRQWAHELAGGGTPPRPVEILEAGLVLEVREPMAALEEAAETIARVRQLEKQATAARDDRARQLEPFGGEQGLADRIAELTVELERLRGLANPWSCMAAGQLAGEASRLRSRNPLLWPPASEATPAASTEIRARHPRVAEPVDGKPAASRRERARGAVA